MYAARDRYNDVWIFNNEPYFNDRSGLWEDVEDNIYDALHIKEKILPELTFENSPMEIEIKIKEK